VLDDVPFNPCYPKFPSLYKTPSTIAEFLRCS
jgi:hypothetical protein